MILLQVVTCHGPKTSFEDFIAFMDYDTDGTIEPVSGEIEGLLTLVASRIPPYDGDHNFLGRYTSIKR